MYAWYAVAVRIGVIVYRRSSVVKDTNTTGPRRKIKHVYEAEERGVVNGRTLDGTMDATTQQGLGRSVSELSVRGGDGTRRRRQSRGSNAEWGRHIVKANARVWGRPLLTMKP